MGQSRTFDARRRRCLASSPLRRSRRRSWWHAGHGNTMSHRPWAVIELPPIRAAAITHATTVDGSRRRCPRGRSRTACTATCDLHGRAASA